MCFKANLAGMGRYTYLPIRYYHDTWADTIFSVIFFVRISILQVLRVDIAMCCAFCFCF